MRISDWSSDVCSSDLAGVGQAHNPKAILSKGRFLGASKKSLEDLHVTRRNGRVVLCAIVPKIQAAPAVRSEERRVGKACVSTFRSRWSPYHYKKKKHNKLKSDTYVQRLPINIQ